jgi:hypothetical protein
MTTMKTSSATTKMTTKTIVASCKSNAETRRDGEIQSGTEKTLLFFSVPLRILLRLSVFRILY